MCIYINWAAPAIDILFVCGLPSDEYQLGSPMIDTFNLFVDYPPMNINWAAPTIDIFNLDYPPIINIFRQPSEPFSLNSSHALTPIALGCSSAYGMHVCHVTPPIPGPTRLADLNRSPGRETIYTISIYYIVLGLSLIRSSLERYLYL